MHFGLSDNSTEDTAYNPAKTKTESATSSVSEDDCTFYLDLIKNLKQNIDIPRNFVVKQ